MGCTATDYIILSSLVQREIAYYMFLVSWKCLTIKGNDQLVKAREHTSSLVNILIFLSVKEYFTSYE